MSEKEFCLLYEPWIRVIDSNCNITEVSLIELFENAHNYKDLCGELPTQDFAVLRLLLAVLHTVFSRYEINGKSALLKDPDDALDRWQELWENKRFPADVIKRYLETQVESFWLFHPERPFYQTKFAEGASKDYGISKLNGVLSKSDNKPRLFTMISGTNIESMSFSEAARWIVSINSFDDSAVKPMERGKEHDSPGVGWLGKLGLVAVSGNDLFETLMLNLIFLNENGEMYGKENPIWEQNEPIRSERIKVLKPNNLSELYTFPSRFLLLKRNSNKVVKYKVLSGKFFEERNAFIEPMTFWVNKGGRGADKFEPKTHSADKQFWKDFSSMVQNSDKNHPPGIISWIKKLEDDERVNLNMFVVIKIVSVKYGDKNSKIVDIFSDSLKLHASLISEMNIGWQTAVTDCVGFCDKISGKVAALARDVDLAQGGSKSTKDSKGTSAIMAEKSKADFYNRIDVPFRRWLCALNPETDEQEERRMAWRSECVKIAQEVGDEIIKQASSAAIFGKRSKSDEKSDKKSVSAANAMNRFKIGLSIAKNE